MTTYKEVYESFLSKTTEYEFLKIDKATLEAILEPYLRSALPRFRRPRFDIKDRDDVSKLFNAELSLMEIEILATLMVVEFLRPAINDSRIKKQVMTDKEFRFYSQKNHLDGLMALYKMMKDETVQLMRDYSFERLGEDNDN